MLQSALQAAAPALVTLLSTLLVAVLSLAVNALKKKLNSDRALAILDRFEHLADDVVLEAEQTVVTQLKSAAAAGTKLSPADAKDVAEVVLAKLKSHIGPQGIAEARKVLGLDDAALNSLLNAKIEATVAAMNVNASAPK